MKKINAKAFGLTFFLMVLILHPGFHIWTILHPSSYELMVRTFFPGFVVEITPFDYSIGMLVYSSLIKACVFGGVNYIGALLYNSLTKRVR